MRRSLAKWLVAGLPVVWDVEDPPKEPVTATVVQVVHVHHHYVHLLPGATAIEAAELVGTVPVLPLPRDAITSIEEG